jgi:hypothetical protein
LKILPTDLKSVFVPSSMKSLYNYCTNPSQGGGMNKIGKIILVIAGVFFFTSCSILRLESEDLGVGNQVSVQGITTSGWVGQDEIWQGEILITGDVVIPSGVTVTIQPGTSIRSTTQRDDQDNSEDFDQNDETFDLDDGTNEHTPLVSIVVLGALDAQGTSKAPILFTSDSQSPSNVDWQGIMVEGDGSVRLDYVTVENSQFGLQLVSGTLNLSVSNSTFQDIKVCAICADGASPLGNEIVISFSRFIRCDREAIDTYADQPIIVHDNFFTENHVAIMSVGSTITIEKNLFINNERGIGVVNEGKPYIAGNAFTQTQEAAIFITNATPIITNNNFYENSFNLHIEGGAQNIEAHNNW